jgi:hypothetical protein
VTWVTSKRLVLPHALLVSLGGSSRIPTLVMPVHMGSTRRQQLEKHARIVNKASCRQQRKIPAKPALPENTARQDQAARCVHPENFRLDQSKLRVLHAHLVKPHRLAARPVRLVHMTLA